MWQKSKNIYHLFIALLANVANGIPSQKITVIGVTGTDGKTTTTSLIYHILTSAGLKASMISSVGVIVGEKKYDIGFHVTTPSSFSLQGFIRKAIKANSNYLVLETTSHALDQYRVFGIKFDIGVLTNVTHEHLDYHKTYENYVKTKAKLLKSARIAVVNKDDESYALICPQLENQKVITYGLGDEARLNPIVFPFKTNMIGKFNTYNSLAAIAVCRELRLSDSDIRKGLLSFKPPLGRQDVVYKNDFSVMIDFAHTPNAFEEILSSIRSDVKGKIIHVFGSAGARDKSKRPKMGKISAKYSDVIILTSEDPRKEPVENIIEDIEKGIMESNMKKTVLKITDRKKAIFEAIKMAKKDDMVLITGKSHETSMNFGKGEEKWDEYEVVHEALRLRSG